MKASLGFAVIFTARFPQQIFAQSKYFLLQMAFATFATCCRSGTALVSTFYFIYEIYKVNFFKNFF